MFQRLSNLLFGAVEDVSAEISGPKPCVSEVDDEGWLLVSVPAWLYLLLLPLPLLPSFHPFLLSCPAPAHLPSGDRNCTTLSEDGAEVPSIAQSLPHSECQRVESGCDIATPPSCTGDSAPFSCKRRRTRAGRSQAVCPPSSRSLRPRLSPDSPSPLGSGGANALSDPTSCGLDESWFITPPPCFTAEGAPAEASPMEDLLIEHPSMSVYVSSSNLEQSTANMADSVSRMTESTPAPVPTRLVRGSACQAVPLAKVTQVSRVQRAKARVERRHLGRGRMQRQNRVRQQIPRTVAHTRSSFLHQPCQRNLCH